MSFEPQPLAWSCTAEQAAAAILKYTTAAEVDISNARDKVLLFISFPTSGTGTATFMIDVVSCSIAGPAILRFGRSGSALEIPEHLDGVSAQSYADLVRLVRETIEYIVTEAIKSEAGSV